MAAAVYGYKVMKELQSCVVVNLSIEPPLEPNKKIMGSW